MEKKTLELSEQQLQIINEGLMLVPYWKAAPVINSINAQIQATFDQKRDDDPASGATAKPTTTADTDDSDPKGVVARRARRSAKHG
ncbi:hypothetical protein [Burkholderia seminalis]|uniref:hypothetical protein n=1 Tax=Burkholderia seminalis TaxID=488731 RepID=UPI000F5B0E60|nr:hypothetical protein [Burkholderia seminalis]RQS88079.1 hypothetical protein DF048_27545 [Burkholderia seminalis]